MTIIQNNVNLHNSILSSSHRLNRQDDHYSKNYQSSNTNAIKGPRASDVNSWGAVSRSPHRHNFFLKTAKKANVEGLNHSSSQNLLSQNAKKESICSSNKTHSQGTMSFGSFYQLPMEPQFGIIANSRDLATSGYIMPKEQQEPDRDGHFHS